MSLPGKAENCQKPRGIVPQQRLVADEDERETRHLGGHGPAVDRCARHRLESCLRCIGLEQCGRRRGRHSSRIKRDRDGHRCSKRRTVRKEGERLSGSGESSRQRRHTGRGEFDRNRGLGRERTGRNLDACTHGALHRAAGGADGGGARRRVPPSSPPSPLPPHATSPSRRLTAASRTMPEVTRMTFPTPRRPLRLARVTDRTTVGRCCAQPRFACPAHCVPRWSGRHLRGIRARGG